MGGKQTAIMESDRLGGNAAGRKQEADSATGALAFDPSGDRPRRKSLDPRGTATRLTRRSKFLL